MLDYSEMYRKLLGAQADAIEELKGIMDKLIKAHRQVEDMYINAVELNDEMLLCEHNMDISEKKV